MISTLSPILATLVWDQDQTSHLSKLKPFASQKISTNNPPRWEKYQKRREKFVSNENPKNAAQTSNFIPKNFAQEFNPKTGDIYDVKDGIKPKWTKKNVSSLKAKIKSLKLAQTMTMLKNKLKEFRKTNPKTNAKGQIDSLVLENFLHQIKGILMGANGPLIESLTKKCALTSQNAATPQKDPLMAPIKSPKSKRAKKVKKASKKIVKKFKKKLKNKQKLVNHVIKKKNIKKLKKTIKKTASTSNDNLKIAQSLNSDLRHTKTQITVDKAKIAQDQHSVNTSDKKIFDDLQPQDSRNRI